MKRQLVTHRSQKEGAGAATREGWGRTKGSTGFRQDGTEDKSLYCGFCRKEWGK